MLNTRTCALLLVTLIMLSASISTIHPAAAYTNTVVVKAPAVSTTRAGYQGVMTDIEVTVVKPGHGRVYLSVSPLTEVDMQASVRMAAFTACKILQKDFFQYDFYVSVTSPVLIVGGPSAGALLTVAMIAAITNTSFPKTCTMTGMINPDGTIGPVGGIFEKAEAAHEAGMKLFLIPLGQRMVEKGGETIDIVDYAAKNWGLTVVEVGSIFDAVKYALGIKISYNVTLNEPAMPEQLKEILQNTTTCLANEAEQLIEKVESINIPDKELSDVVSQVLNTAKTYLTRAENFEKDGLFYSAASAAFAATYHAQYAMNIMDSMVLGNYTDFFSKNLAEVNSSIAKLKEQLSEVKPSKLSDIDILAAVQERIRLAEDALSSAKEEVGMGKLYDALYDLAYAKWRLETARYWLRSLGLGEASAPSTDKLIPVAEMFLYEAKSIASYAYTLMSEMPATINPLLTSAKEDLDTAEALMAEGATCGALAYSISASAKASTAISQLFAIKESLLDYQVNFSRTTAIAMINMAIKTGAVPALALSYFEFAEHSIQSLPEKAGKFEKLLYYRMASLHAAMLTALSGEAPSIEVQPSKVSPPPVIGSQQIYTILYVLTAFAAGLFIGAVIESRHKAKQPSELRC